MARTAKPATDKLKEQMLDLEPEDFSAMEDWILNRAQVLREEEEAKARRAKRQAATAQEVKP
jgi:hypothetical protein